MKKLLAVTILGLASMNAVHAADYVIDTKGMHAGVQFRTKHLGFSWLYGRFNDFSGNMSYDEANPNASKVDVVIQMKSLDSNHAERDKHLRSDDFLSVDQYPEAKFVSTSFESQADGKGVLKGDLTLKGVTKNVMIDVMHIGGGSDPWGGERIGFEGSTSFAASDFGIDNPAVGEVEMILSVEGIKK